MRISTTLLLTCAILLGSATAALAVPTVTITNLKHACGGNANGSFQVNVTAATGAQVKIRVFGPPTFTDIDQTFAPIPALPFSFPVSNAPGSTDPAGEEYIVIVSDGTGNRTVFVYVYDFTASLVTLADNTNPGCASPNGAIDINLDGSSPAGAIQYTWTWSGGALPAPNTQDLSNLSGGDYNLSYTDGTTTCTLGPFHINDPAASAFTISAPASVCENNGFNIDVSMADNGYTYTVLEGATVITSAPGAGGPLTIPIAAQTPGSHTYRVQATSGVCPPRFNDAPDVTVTVNPAPDYNNSSPSLCSNTAIGLDLSTLKNASSVAATSFVIVDPIQPDPGLVMVTGSPTNVSVSSTEIANDVWRNTTNGPLHVIYNVATFAGVCPGNVIVVDVTINPEPDYNNYNNTATPGGICSRDLLNVTLDGLKKGTSVLADSYTVTAVSSAGLTAFAGVNPAAPPYNVTSTDLANDQWRNIGNVPRDVAYTIVPKLGACAGPAFEVRVTINPQPFAPNIPKTICSQAAVNVNLQTDAIDLGNGLVGTTFSWTSASTPGVSGATPGPSTNAVIADVLVNTSSTIQTVTYTVTPSKGSCVGSNFLVTITVNPEPVAPNITKTICSKDNVNVDLQTDAINLGNGIASTQFSWTSADNLNVFGETPGPSTSSTIGDALINTSSTSQDVTYTVTPTSPAPAGCAGSPFTVTVTVNPQPTAPAGLNKTICSGDQVAFDLQTGAIDLGNAIAGSTFTWGAANNGNVGGESPGPKTPSTIDDFLTNTTGAPEVVVYTIIPKSPDNCVGDPFDVSITVEPRPSYHDFDNIATGGICATPVGVDITTLKNPGSIDATSFAITILNGGLVQVAGMATTSDISDDVWQNTTNAAVDVTYQIDPSVGSCVGAQFTVIIRIKPQPEYVNTPASQCSNVALGFDLNTARNITSSIANQFDITNMVAQPGLTPKSGIVPSPVPGVLNTEIADDVWENLTGGPLTVTYTITPRTGACDGASFDIVATIDPEPIYTDLPAADLCSQQALAIDLDGQKGATSITATNFTFTTISGALVPVGPTVTSGSGNAMVLADDQWSNTTNAPILLTYNIIPEATAGGCAGAPFKITVNINPEPDYNGFTAPAGICAVPTGFDVTTLKKSTSAAADLFVVQSATPSDPALLPVGGTATPDDISDDVWSNVTNGQLFVDYTIVPSLGGCAGAPFHVIIKIDPQPDYLDYNNNNAPGGICSGDAIAVDLTTLVNAGSVAATSFAITTPPTAPGLTLVSTDPTIISDDIWTNTTTGFVDIIYSIIPTAGSCAGAQFTVTVRVNPEPTAPPVFKTICTGDDVNIDLQNDAIELGNGIDLTGFQWSVADNPNVFGEFAGTSNNPIISDVLFNNTASPELVFYTVTPTSPNGCVGADFIITVTVAAKPVIVPGQTKTICSGSGVDLEILLSPLGQPAGTIFSWPSPGIAGATASPPGGVAANPNGTLHITDILFNTNPGPLTVTYQVTASIGSCSAAPVNIDITVNQGATANAGNDQSICTDNGPYTLGLGGASIGGAATQGTWTIVSTPAVHDESINQPDPFNPGSAEFTATEAGDYVLQLTTNDPDGPMGICGTATDFVTITVTGKPVIAPLQATTVCGNDPIAYEIQMVGPVPANTIFTWADPDGPTGATNATASAPGGVQYIGPGTKHLMDILINETSSNIPLTYTITPSVGLCVGQAEDIIVTVKPSPVLAFGQTKTICSGERVDLEILLNPANTPLGTTFSWPDPDGTGSATSQDDIAAEPAGTFHITDTLYHFDPLGASKTVTYKVISKGINGCYGRTRDIDIIVNSGALADAGPAQQVCSDGVLTLSNASIAGAADGTWAIVSGPAGGIINNVDITNPATATFQAATPGKYTLELTTGAPTAGLCGPVTDRVVITVKPIGDPSCTGSGGGPCATIATLTVTDATCNNNDGSIKVENVTGGTAPYTYTLNGTIVNLPANQTLAGLTAGNYQLDITDANSCVKTYNTVISFPGFIAYTTPITTDPDCTGGGANGAVQFSITDPGSFKFAITSDLIIEPADSEFNQLGGSLVSVNNLSRGDYAIWLKPVGAGVKCATKVPVTISGVYAVSYTATTSNVICFGQPIAIVVNDIQGAPALPYQYTLTNTNDNSTSTGTITPSQALGAYSITGVNKGNYSLLITQDQSSIAASCVDPLSGNAISLVVDGPSSALDTLYVKKSISVPDLPSGSALVGVAPSGLEPYEVKLELTTPLFASQQYIQDWTIVPLSTQSLKFEYSFTNIYSGVYTLGLRDAGGCEKTYVFTIDVDTDLFIPNIFTPNEDGYNDVFYIRNLPVDTKVLITNRWGKEVFKSSSYQNDWNGGDTVDGMYYYTVTIGSKSYTGWVEILRAQ